MKARLLMRSRGPELAAAGAALLLRLWFLHLFAAHALFTPVAGGHDRTLYHEAARRVAEGAWWPDGAFSHLPLYPWVLGLAYALGGATLHTAALLGLACDSLTAGLVVALARRLGARPGVALAAGLAYAAYPLAIAYAPLTMPNTLNALLLAAFTLGLVAAPADRPRPWLALGLLAGLLTLGFAGLPLILLALLAGWNRPRRRAPAPAAASQAALVLGLLLVVAPVVFHNSRAEGRLVFLTTHGGFNLYMGNHEQATGHPVRVRNFRMTARDLLDDAHQAAESAVGRPLKRSESSAWWAGQARAFWQAHPGAALRLFVRKALLVWNHEEVDDLRMVDQVRLAGLAFTHGPWPAFALFGWMGLFGLARARAAPVPRLVLLAGLAGLVLYFVTARYRLTFVPLMAALGAAAASGAFADLKAGRHRTPIALAALVAALVVALPLPGRDVRAVDYHNLAVQLQAAGRMEEALRTADAGLAVDPQSADLWHVRGTSLYRLNRHADAAAAFARCATLNPGHPQAAYNLALSLAHLQDYCGARAALEEAAGRRTLPGQAGALLEELRRACPAARPAPGGSP